ncbi:MAG TPA: ABC transporter ATP-binding protein [Clostridiales bacterium]|nr:ABC transporter ATP-binding protein [Clostridiales bacterium]
MALLEVEGLEVSYGLIKAVKGVSFTVEKGEIVALIGANGAGKTTIMHAISGLIPKAAGKVAYNGEDITSLAPHKITAKGISQVPEGRRIFQELTVYENLVMGAYTRKSKKEFKDTLSYVYDRFPILKERKNQVAGTLSGGEQQMLAMGRALMSKPKIILMDEPSMGLSPIFVGEIFTIIEKVANEGKTVLLVEQNAKKALSIADRAYVLETGSISLSGKAEDLLHNDDIRKAYLGE